MVVTPDNPKQWMADAEHRAQRYGDDDLLTKAYGHIAELEKRLEEAEEIIQNLADIVDEEWGCDCGDANDPPCSVCRARAWLEGK